MKTLSIIIDIFAFCLICTGQTQVSFDNFKYSPNTQQYNYLETKTKNFFASANEKIITNTIVQSEQFWNTAKQILAVDAFVSQSLEEDIRAIAAMQNLLKTVTSNSITQISGTYLSTDQNGDSILLSGKIYIPKNKPIKKIIIANHYTIGSNKEAPSQAFCFEGIFALKGYAVVMADYIGYGTSTEHTHPYLHKQSTVQSVVDMAIAARHYLNVSRQRPQSDTIIIVGYSQGGAVTLQTQQFLEKQYPTTFPIKQVYAGGGPYNLTATYDYYVEHDETGIPCAIPMIVQGLNIGENLGLEMQDFFQEPLLSNYQTWINSKNYTINAINRFIGETHISHILTSSATDKTTQTTNKLYTALQHNSIIDWTPKAPIYLFHSIDDDMVPFINSETLQQSFSDQCLDNITYNFAHYGSHMNAAIEFLKTVYDLLD